MAKRVASVQHLARKTLVATETRHFPSPLWALCVLGRREGFASHVQLHATRCLSPLDSSAGFPRRPPAPRSSPQRVFGAPQADVDTQERSMGWDLLQGGAPRAESPSPVLGATRTRMEKLLVCSWEMLMPHMLVGSLPDLLSLRLGSSCCPGRRWLLRKVWMVSGLPDPLRLPHAAAIRIHPPIPGQGGSSDLCSWLSFGGESQMIPPGMCPGQGDTWGRTSMGCAP